VNKKKSFSRIVGDFFAGKGFYVVLFLCVAVIGISAWILLSTPARVKTPDIHLDATYTPSLPAQEASAPQDETLTELPDIDELAEQPVVRPRDEGVAEQPKASPEAKDNQGEAENQPNKSTSPEDNAEDERKKSSSTSLTFVWPVLGDIQGVYAVSELVYNKTLGDWRAHPGIDIAAPLGAKVYAAADGTVTDISVHDLLGTVVTIEHAGGLVSKYANLASVPVVKVGDQVAQNAVIGSVGDTALGESSEASHLHFEMWKDGEPVSPTEYLPNR
jgi:murein DD-endopeptidase MepM/ murein hydrolase activator NlpD